MPDLFSSVTAATATSSEVTMTGTDLVAIWSSVGAFNASVDVQISTRASSWFTIKTVTTADAFLVEAVNATEIRLVARSNACTLQATLGAGN